MRLAAIATAALFALTPLLAALPAEAASRSTARASGDIPVRSGPGSGYRVIGELADGTRVRLERCTREQLWCLILDPRSGQPAGWVRGSYLVGSGAKLEVTPHRFLEFDPMDPLGRCKVGDDDSFFCR